ncbi:MAG: leucine/isoleucine/valine transporter permease subunit [Armatimonadetes bacterium CSP1-3]|nr:MAG: leucine/isoleucine/valine transporter permease subunit [Armatimonadetes bacterium CSP1-3]
MRSDRGSWGRVISGGLIFGAAAVFVSLVGMVEALGVRVIVIGVIDFGRLLLLLIGLGAGYQAARRGGGGVVIALLRGLLAGAATGAGLAALLVLGSEVNLRGMFINASPALFEIISFGRGAAGVPLVVAAGAVVGVLGAAATLLPGTVRGPLGAGVTATIVIGLFQELLQIILQGEEGVRAAIRQLIFVPEGLPPRGALEVFVVVLVASALWRSRRPVVRGWISKRPPRTQRLLRLLGLLLAVAVVLVLPAAGGLFVSQVLVLVGLYTLMGLGLNLEVGFAGLLDLGFVAFFAIGAYTVGLLTSTGQYGVAHWSFWAAVPVALVVSLIAGFLFGLPILRIRGDYLAIATLGFGEIIRLLALSDALRPWFGGSQGILAVPKPNIGGFEFSGPMQIFYITLVSSAFIAFVAARLRDSRLGRAWMAMREDEDVAEAMGINLINVKLLAYGIGGAFAGMGGAIFAALLGSIFPHSFNLLISINVLALIIVGGMGSLPGVVVGSLFLVGLPELLREFSDFRFLVYGAALIIMMQVKPAGLWPAAAVRRELLKEEPVGAVTEGPVAERAEA